MFTVHLNPYYDTPDDDSFEFRYSLAAKNGGCWHSLPYPPLMAWSRVSSESTSYKSSNIEFNQAGEHEECSTLCADDISSLSLLETFSEYEMSPPPTLPPLTPETTICHGSGRRCSPYRPPATIPLSSRRVNRPCPSPLEDSEFEPDEEHDTITDNPSDSPLFRHTKSKRALPSSSQPSSHATNSKAKSKSCSRPNYSFTQTRGQVPQEEVEYHLHNARHYNFECPMCKWKVKSKRLSDFVRHIETIHGTKKYFCVPVRWEEDFSRMETTARYRKRFVRDLPTGRKRRGPRRTNEIPQNAYYRLSDGSLWVGGCMTSFTRRDALKRHRGRTCSYQGE